MYIDFLPIELEEFWTPAHLLEETMYCRRCLGFQSLFSYLRRIPRFTMARQLDPAFFAIRFVVLSGIFGDQSDMLGSRRFIYLESSSL
jgi:hypothetical protein